MCSNFFYVWGIYIRFIIGGFFLMSVLVLCCNNLIDVVEVEIIFFGIEFVIYFDFFL